MFEPPSGTTKFRVQGPYCVKCRYCKDRIARHRRVGLLNNRNVTVQKCTHFWGNKNVAETTVAGSVTCYGKSIDFFFELGFCNARISRQLVDLRSLQRSQSSSDDIMESTPDNDAIKEILQQWAGEDTEIVFEKLPKLQSIEKVYRGKTSTGRIHDIIW